MDCLSKEISRLSAFRDSGSFERGRSKDFVFPATSMRSIIVQGFFREKLAAGMNQCREPSLLLKGLLLLKRKDSPQ